VTTSKRAILRVAGVEFGFSPGQRFLGPIDFDQQAKTVCAVVGPNGAGKTTLLRLIAGLVAPSAGSVCLAGVPLSQQSSRQRARALAYVAQNQPVMEDVTFVLLGRYPYRRLGLFESIDDEAAVARALDRAQVTRFRHRRMADLSGGEAQRVRLAAALVQETPLLVLDEPTSDLDVWHQLDVFRLLRGLVCEDGLAVLVVTHDLNLALHFSDRALLLNQGRQIAFGQPTEVLQPASLERVYGVPFETLESPRARASWLVPVTEGADAGSSDR